MQIYNHMIFSNMKIQNFKLFDQQNNPRFPASTKIQRLKHNKNPTILLSPGKSLDFQHLPETLTPLEATFPTWTVAASGSTSTVPATPPAGGVGNAPENEGGVDGWLFFWIWKGGGMWKKRTFFLLFHVHDTVWLFFFGEVLGRQKLLKLSNLCRRGEEKVVRRRSQPRQATQSSEPQQFVIWLYFLSSKIRDLFQSRYLTMTILMLNFS